MTANKAPADEAYSATIETLSRLDLIPRSIALISTLRSPTQTRFTYRVELTNGETIKARFLETAAAAEFLVELRSGLPVAFAPILHQHGRVLIEEWVNGTPLNRIDLSETKLRQAAALLAELHLHPVQLSGRHVPVQTDIRQQVQSSLARVQKAGYLELSEVDAVLEKVNHLYPERINRGLSHMDFCGENIVVTPDGTLRIIDNERVGISPFGLDLARCWYRWALPENAWSTFRDEYVSRSRQHELVEQFQFWTFVATAHATGIRLRMDPSQIDPPLKLLRRLLAGS